MILQVIPGLFVVAVSHWIGFPPSKFQELIRGVIPFVIRRFLPDNTYEDWKVVNVGKFLDVPGRKLGSKVSKSTWVVSNILYFHPYLGKICNFDSYFFGWNETTN